MFDVRSLNRTDLIAPVLLTGLAASAAPAHAQDALSIAVTGTLAQSCSANVPGDQTIDPASSRPQAIGTASFSCNFAGIPTIRFWSADGGRLVTPASAGDGNATQALPYQLSYDGTAIGQLTDAADTATPVTRMVTAGIEKLGIVSIQITTPALVAGTYADTIYLAIVP